MSMYDDIGFGDTYPDDDDRCVDPVALEGRVDAVTGSAVLVYRGMFDDPLWVPLSIILDGEPSGGFVKGCQAEITIPEWFAEQEGVG